MAKAYIVVEQDGIIRFPWFWDPESQGSWNFYIFWNPHGFPKNGLNHGNFFAPTIKWAKDSIAIVGFPKKIQIVREIVIEKLKMPVWPRLPSNFPFLTWFSEISAKNTSIKKKKLGGVRPKFGVFFRF